MLMNCTERAYRRNKSRMVPIAEYSRDCLKQLRADTGIAYDERTQGTLQLFRTQNQLDGIAKDVVEALAAFELSPSYSARIRRPDNPGANEAHTLAGQASRSCLEHPLSLQPLCSAADS